MENNTYLKIVLSFVNGIGVANSMFKDFVIYTTLATVAFVLVGFYGMNRHPELLNYIGYYELIFLAPKYSVPFWFYVFYCCQCMAVGTWSFIPQ